MRVYFSQCWFDCILSMMVCMPFASPAQDEYLATLNYNNLSLNRISNIPGMTWVSGNSAYDQNHQRYFFQGGLNQGGPFDLYTINAVSGAIIFNSSCPAGNPLGSIQGLQYDNGNDTLYGIYYDGAGAADFAWIDPATGMVHVISNLPGYGGFSQSVFDTKDQLYIVSNGGSLMGIRVSSGAILFNWANSLLSDMMFDNLTGKMYGINLSTFPNPTFDSVSLSTGIAYPIANLPTLGLIQNFVIIDENAGKYVFLGQTYSTSGCVEDSLYSLNLNTDAIESARFFPYSPGGTNPVVENVINFCFDNKRETLYALNWFPPGSSPVNLPVTITTAPSLYCPGSLVSFTAVPETGIFNPVYQWQVNGNNVGIDNSTYSSNNLAEGDQVRCIVTNNLPCTVGPQDTSNSIPVSFSAALKESVSIVEAEPGVCKDQPDTFIAHTINRGSPIVFKWILNGKPVGTNDSVYTGNSFGNGDSIICVITSGSGCVLPGPDSSNLVVIQVHSVNSALTISASATSICSGDTVLLKAFPVNAGASPNYQWQINGIGTGISSDSLMTPSLMNGDVLTCVMTSSIPCALAVSSNNIITMTVNPTPTISFNPDTLVIKQGASVKLNPVVGGSISSYIWTPQTALDNSTEMSPTASPVNTTTYQLTLTASDGCQAAGKQTVLLYAPLDMPNAFTPNGDGKNEVFRIPPSFPQKIQSFSVYNRWGQCVFRTENSSGGWDGTFHNEPQPPGAYVWMIRYQDPLINKIKMASGTVLLIR